MIRVLLVDDHDAVLEGLAGLLRGEPDIELVAAVRDGQAALASARQSRPDVVIMDAAMRGMNGAEVTRRILRDLPGVRVIALSMHTDPDLIDEMRRAGAEEYLDKAGPYEDLLAVVRRRAARGAPPGAEKTGTPTRG
jgi:DNA-binding NarL/FixJ family response regulator